jgi:hypothetical protein
MIVSLIERSCKTTVASCPRPGLRAAPLARRFSDRAADCKFRRRLTWGASGQGLVHSRMGQIPRAVSVSEVQARLHDAARFRARSTSHTVAVQDGCTNIPLAAGMVQTLATDRSDPPQGRLGDGFGVAVVVLPPHYEGLDVDCGNGAWLMAERPRRPTNEMRAKAGFDANDAGRQLPECRDKIQAFDLSTQSNLSILGKAHDMKDILSDVDANRRQDGSGVVCCCFHGMLLLLLCG